jgi:hypothetical protein
MTYKYDCQVCGETLERCINSDKRKFTCFDCKTRHKYYNQARRKKESLARPYKPVTL